MNAGIYNATVSFAGLVRALLTYARGEKIPEFFLQPYLVYLRGIFSESLGWNYATGDRYELAKKILDVFDEVRIFLVVHRVVVCRQVRYIVDRVVDDVYRL
jgi:hypothetical protein